MGWPVWPFRKNANDRCTEKACSDNLGPRGEKIASRYLRRAGFRILAKNYRCPAGECDILALDKKNRCLTFIEVKTRSRDDNVSPLSAVNADKQRRLRNIAKYYLSRHETGELEVRFDVIAVVIRPGEKPDIEHIPAAFQ